MKKYLLLSTVISWLFPCAFSQGTLVYCLNDPDRVPNYFTYAIQADGSDNRPMLSTNIGLNHFEWSPDGTKIACVGYQNMETSWSIYVFEADGTGLVRLTNTTGVLDGALSWSPDGSRIAFTRSYSSQPNRAHELWIMNADGSDQHFSGIYGFQPMWSPDGTKFVYCSSKAGNWEIYVTEIDGTDEQRLTTNSSTDLNPVWSPDGTRIAFMSERAGNSEIYIMQADGTRPVRLTMNTVYDGMPRWSPDGSCLAFNSASGGNQKIEIFIIQADGSDMRQVTYSEGNMQSINPAWRPISSSGITFDNGSTHGKATLEQNYPNPVTFGTTIGFSLSDYGHVRLDILDLSGRALTRLVDEEMPPGNHSVVWNIYKSGVGIYQDGIYIYSLEGVGFKISKTATVISR